MKKESPNSTLFPPFYPRRGQWFGFVVLPILIWGVLFATRPLFYQAWCAAVPSPCTFTSVNTFDRIVFQFGSMRADFWSNVIQNLTGLAAYTLPWFWYPGTKRAGALRESFYLLSITFWNLSALEIARVLVQRPRPLVFNSPMTDGANIHQYTSFYSGHTSFTALAGLGLFFIARRRFAATATEKTAGYGFFSFYLVTSISVGVLRIFGGRHFPSDVIFGFAAGTLFAVTINRWFRRQFSEGIT